jgi:signal transduction histidine kinase
VDNAFHHGRGRVALAASCRNGRGELHVVDEGAGFPPQFLDRAFDRFSRADDARGSEGSGLGLAIVETIARAHNGEARAANRAEGGADQWLSLPLCGRAASNEGSASADDAPILVGGAAAPAADETIRP